MKTIPLVSSFLLLYTISQPNAARALSRIRNVTTILLEPFTMLNPDAGSNRKFIGYVPDLLDRLSEKVVFRYELNHVIDGKYGTKNKDGAWTGMIGELLNAQTDIAAAAITITSGREEDIDFIQAFMHTGITAVIKKLSLPTAEARATATVTPIFTWGVLAIIAGAYVVVSLSLWLMNRYNPYEWGGAANITAVSLAQRNYFNLVGSFWYSFTIAQWQGFDRSPRCLASRVISVAWMSFTTLTLITATAVIFNHIQARSTALPPIGSIGSPIPTLEDIISDDAVDYGTVNGGSVLEYFAKGKGPMYDAVRQYRQRKPEMFVSSVEDAIHRVQSGDGKYAFLCEAATALTMVNKKPCDLMMISETIPTWSYGFAVHPGSDLKNLLHLAMLELHENGELKALERKWFYLRGECWDKNTNVLGQPRPNVTFAAARATHEAAMLPATLGVREFSVPLIALGVGIILSLLVVALEISYYRFMGKVNSGSDSHKQEEDMDAMLRPVL